MEKPGKGLQLFAYCLLIYGIGMLALKAFSPELLDTLGGNYPFSDQVAFGAVFGGIVLNFISTVRTMPRDLGAIQYSSNLRVMGKEVHSVSSTPLARDEDFQEDEDVEEGEEEEEDESHLAHLPENLDSLLNQNKEWAAGKVSCKKGTTALILWGVGILFNLVAIPASFAVTENIRRGEYIVMVIYILPLVGLGILALAARFTIQARKFGKSTFEISNRTGRIGGKLAGVIRTSVPLQAEGDYTIKLICSEQTTTGTGKNRQTRTKVLWQTSQKLGQGACNPLSGIPVSFDIPKHCYESFDGMSSGTVSWKVEISVPTPGVDYDADFEVPVFRVK